MSEELVKTVINKFAENLIGFIKEGYFSLDYITKGGYVYGCKYITNNDDGKNCHARVLSCIAKTGFDLGYAVEWERTIKLDDGKSKKPDLLFIGKNTNFEAVIEFESQNASSYDLYRGDENYCYKVCRYAEMLQPAVCIYILTLTQFQNKWDENMENRWEFFPRIVDELTYQIAESDKEIESTAFCLCPLDEVGLHPEIFYRNGKSIKLEKIKIFTKET